MFVKEVELVVGKPFKKVYEVPAIIYEGQITTRAGTVPGPIAGEGADPIDPSGLFGND